MLYLKQLFFLLSYLCPIIQSYAVSTVQPFGIPFSPLTFHVAALFLTNVPLAATFFTQLLVYPAQVLRLDLYSLGTYYNNNILLML